jgi:hypothetical protein
MDAVITYTKKIPVGKIVLAIPCFIITIFGLFSGNLMAFIFLALGLNFIAAEGAELDLMAKTYRTITVLFGIKVGSWKQNPKFEYVSVFRTHESQRINVVTATTVIREELLFLNLFYGNKHITFYKTKDKEDAFKVARHIASAMQIDVLDATGTEKVWL